MAAAFSCGMTAAWPAKMGMIATSAVTDFMTHLLLPGARLPAAVFSDVALKSGDPAAGTAASSAERGWHVDHAAQPKRPRRPVVGQQRYPYGATSAALIPRKERHVLVASGHLPGASGLGIDLDCGKAAARSDGRRGRRIRAGHAWQQRTRRQGRHAD